MHKTDLDKYMIEKNELKAKKLNGYNIVYSESKNTNNKHVLFIHGLGASFFGWRDIPDALSKYFHTIAVDLIGFGLSDKPEIEDYYTIKGFSKFIIDFIEAIGIGRNEKTTIVGHSLGGYIAAQVAIENKDLIEKLVLIDSSGLLEGPTPLLKEYRIAATEMEPILRYKKLETVFGNMYANRSFMPPVVVDAFIGTIIKQGAKYAFEKTFDNSTSTRLEPKDLKLIEDIPCLIIWGKKDNLIPLEYADKFEQKLPDAICERIEDAGHAPFVEKTALVYEIIRIFLTQ